MISKLRTLFELYKQKKFLNKIFFYKINNLLRLGSDYGGWNFFDHKNLYNSTIITAGLGEDASFDIEFINKYNAKVICIDPTPRAVDHYNQIMKFKGKKKLLKYNDNGNQNINSYNLLKINHKNFTLIDKALYNCDDKILDFYPPPNTKHVSHSLNDWQNNYKRDSKSIKVKTITLEKIVKKNELKILPLLKLDIEGAENEVIENMIENKIFPDQICVEFDELHILNENSMNKFLRTHEILIKENYVPIKINSKIQDMLYLNKKIIPS
tara:strand:+ start:882 stop:1685 length:804 start_codon:yes stop_codon:yes gene_type:complete